MQKIVASDFHLFKKNDFNMLFKKYNPLIKRMSRINYNYISGDASLDYDDIYQMNMMVAWDAMQYTKKIMVEKKFDEGMNFGFFLKERLSTYNITRINKKKSKIDRNNLSVDVLESKSDTYNYTKKYILKDTHDFIPHIEECDLYERFVNQLTKKEQKFIKYLEQHRTAHKIHIKTGLGLSICNSMKKKLKKEFMEFLKKEGYLI